MNRVRIFLNKFYNNTFYRRCINFILCHQGEFFVLALLALFTRAFLILFVHLFGIQVSIVTVILITTINCLLAFFRGVYIMQLYVKVIIKPLLTTKLGQNLINVFHQFIIWIKLPGSVYSDIFTGFLIFLYVYSLFRGINSVILLFAFVFLFYQFTVRAEFFTFDGKLFPAEEIVLVPDRIESYVQNETKLPLHSKRFNCAFAVRMGYWNLNYIRDSNPIVKSVIIDKPQFLSTSRTFLFPISNTFGPIPRRHVCECTLLL